MLKRFNFSIMKQKVLLERYKEYEKTVQEYMKMVSDALVEKFGDIPEVYVVSLDILAGNLVIMTKAITNIATDADGIVGKDNYRGEKKSTSLSAFLAAQNNVIKILTSFGWTPAGASKIRENKEINVEDFLEKLTA